MKPNLEIWKQFYDLAVKVRDEKPWELVDFDELIVVKTHRKTYYCHIMGQDSYDPCIAIYTGKEGLEDIRAVLDCSEENWNGSYLAGDQNCLVCYYGNRDEIPEDQMDIIHAVKPGFRGKGKWVFCKKVMPRYYPATPNNDDLITIINVFEGLLYACEQLKSWQPNWKKQYLCVSYKKKEDSWSAKAITQPNCLLKYPIVRIDQPDLLLDLKDKPEVDDLLFLDLSYMFIPVDDDNGKALNPLVFLAFNLNTELIETMKLIEPEELETAVIMNCVINYMSQTGIPKGIVTRCPRVYYALKELCELMDIELMVDFEGYVNDILEEVVHGFLDSADLPDSGNPGLLN